MKSAALAAMLFLCFPFCTRAASSIAISEVMYNPAGPNGGHVWVELFNAGTSQVSIIGGTGNGSWRIGDHAGNHTFASTVVQGSFSVPMGGYAVVAQNGGTFLADHPGYGGTLIVSSALSLLTAGDTIRIVDGSGSDIDSFTYTSAIGASDDGTSLQKKADIWSAAVPTPGAAAQSSSGSGDDEGGSSDDDTDTSDGEIETGTGTSGTSTDEIIRSATSSRPSLSKKRLPYMTAALTVPKNMIAGVPAKVSYAAFGYYGEDVYDGNFHITFGDGTDFSSFRAGKVEHVFSRPGTYLLRYDYRTNPFYDNEPPEMSVRMRVEVREASVSAVRESDGSVTIRNDGLYDIDMSGWRIGASRPIPEGTTILAGKSITLPSEFATEPVIYLPGGAVAYAGVVVPPPPVRMSSIRTSLQSPVVFTSLASSSIRQTEHVETPAFAAAAANAIPDTDTNGRRSIMPFIAALVVVIGAGMYAVHFLRKKSTEIVSVGEAPSSMDAVAETIRIVEEPDI